MISLHSLLVMEGLLGEGTPKIVLIAIAVLLGLAFLVGAVKGFRKVSWTGLTWLAGVALFALVGMFMPKMEGILGIVVYLILAIACGLVTMVLFKILLRNVRPRVRWVKDDLDGDTSLAQFGLEFEPEYLEYDGEHNYAPYGMRIQRTGFETPGVFARILGGVISMVNMAMLLAPILGIFLMIVKTSSLSATMGDFLTHPIFSVILPYMEKYVFDGLAIGAFMVMAKIGYRRGVIQSLFSIILSVAGIVVVGVSFYLPFSAFAQEGVLATMVERCSVFFVDVPMIGEILGKLLAGGCFLLMGIIIIIILKFLLANLCSICNSMTLTRELDGYIGAVTYAVLAALICVGVWFVLAGVEVLGLYPVSTMLVPEAVLSNPIFQYAKSILAALFGLA